MFNMIQRRSYGQLVKYVLFHSWHLKAIGLRPVQVEMNCQANKPDLRRSERNRANYV